MINIFDNLLSTDGSADICEKLASGKFEDGKNTAGFRAARVKNNEQISWGDDTADHVQNTILDAIWNHENIAGCCHPKKVSRPLISKTASGQGYGLHVDDAQIGDQDTKNRSDLSMTVFLNNPGDYEGGELEIITPYGITSFKLQAGQAITYPSRFLHQVKTVTSGTRLVAVCWIQSHIRNEQCREILLELSQVNQKLHDICPQAPETDLGFKVYSNLMRRWCE